MSFWNIFGSLAISEGGKTIQKISENIRVSSDGVTYQKMGNTTYGSDGSTFIQMGSFSSDGSIKMGNTATGIGSVFNDD